MEALDWLRGIDPGGARGNSFFAKGNTPSFFLKKKSNLNNFSRTVRSVANQGVLGFYIARFDVYAAEKEIPEPSHLSTAPEAKTLKPGSAFITCGKNLLPKRAGEQKFQARSLTSQGYR